MALLDDGSAIVLIYAIFFLSLAKQELTAVYGMMVDGCITERASMRLINVIILFQV